MANDDVRDEVREYRMEELAEAAGITVRTLRFYRERKLIHPPRRAGRIAWYNDHHLARLRTIGALLERGHTLGGIAELLAAFENGRDVGEVLGLTGPPAVPWSVETPVRLTPEELADYFEGEVTPENLAASIDLGYVALDGDTVVHVSRTLLDASSTLVSLGVPLAVVLATARRVREHTDAIAELFTTLVRDHLLVEAMKRCGDELVLGSEELATINAAVEQLRPLSQSVVDAELALAMDRRIRAELDAWPSGEQTDGGSGRAASDSGPTSL